MVFFCRVEIENFARHWKKPVFRDDWAQSSPQGLPGRSCHFGDESFRSRFESFASSLFAVFTQCPACESLCAIMGQTLCACFVAWEWVQTTSPCTLISSMRHGSGASKIIYYLFQCVLLRGSPCTQADTCWLRARYCSADGSREQPLKLHNVQTDNGKPLFCFTCRSSACAQIAGPIDLLHLRSRDISNGKHTDGLEEMVAYMELLKPRCELSKNN